MINNKNIRLIQKNQNARKWKHENGGRLLLVPKAQKGTEIESKNGKTPEQKFSGVMQGIKIGADALTAGINEFNKTRPTTIAGSEEDNVRVAAAQAQLNGDDKGYQNALNNLQQQGQVENNFFSNLTNGIGKAFNTLSSSVKANAVMQYKKQQQDAQYLTDKIQKQMSNIVDPIELKQPEKINRITFNNVNYNG